MITLPAGVSYVDLSLLYSAANHRFLSQQRNYIAKFSVDSDPSAGIGGDEQFIIDVLPTTWTLKQAVRQARKMYDAAMSPEMQHVAKPARWHDFRMYFDTAHKLQIAAGTYVTPEGSSVVLSGALQNGEYVYSTVQDDTGANTYSFHVKGASDTAGADRSFGIMAEYDAMNDTSTDEASATVSNYGDVLNDITAANQQRLQEDGDLPPYDKDSCADLVTKQYHLHAFGQTANVGYSVRSTGFIDAPLGLVKINNNITGNRTLIVTFKAGSAKGIDAEVI